MPISSPQTLLYPIPGRTEHPSYQVFPKLAEPHSPGTRQWRQEVDFYERTQDKAPLARVVIQATYEDMIRGGRVPMSNLPPETAKAFCEAAVHAAGAHLSFPLIRQKTAKAN